MNNNKNEPVITPPKLTYWWLAFFCVALAVFLSLWRGQDANWDLRNYHYYNPYAWVNDRATIDIAPAQLQSFHSPFADLPYYYMTRAGFSSWLVSAILALPAAIALFFLALSSKFFLPRAQQNIYLVAIIIVAATGASGGPLIGTTMSEWHLVALYLCAVWLILKPFAIDDAFVLTKLRLKNVLAAGFLGGLAVGFKLTAGAYALGLAVLVVALPTGLFERSRRLAVLGLGGVAGAVISYGPWGYELWTRFGNPFFPYFNDVFLSPWAEPYRFADTRYVADSLWKFLTTPWLIMKNTVGFVSELSFRDWRLGISLPAFVCLAWATRSAQKRRMWIALLLMFSTIYGLWITFLGYYRYVSLLEVLAPLAIFALIANAEILMPLPRIKMFTAMLITLVMMGTTEWLPWERIKHGAMAVDVNMPSFPEGSMVIIASSEPLAFLTPNLPPEIPVISVINNFMNPAWGAKSKLQILAAQRVAQHTGPLFALVNLSMRNERQYMNVAISDMLLAHGLAVDFNNCKPISSAMSKGTLAACRVNRVPVVPIKWPL